MKHRILGFAGVLAMVVAVIVITTKKTEPAAAEAQGVTPSAVASRSRSNQLATAPSSLPEEAELNQRTRPAPRPPDVKHQPPQEDHPVAEALPDMPGMVISPFNDKVVDVQGIPPGALVADPTFPAEEKKYFRVP